MNKGERDEILMLELKKLLWEVLILTEYFSTLLQDDLDKDTFVLEKHPNRNRKNFERGTKV